VLHYSRMAVRGSIQESPLHVGDHSTELHRDDEALSMLRP
jgi:hypothetical protein